ncbi:MAG: hypothetical protein WCC57_20015 [Paracoccaceae bacterium]
MHSLAPLQTYLDHIGAAVLANDWPTYRAGVCLPFHLVTATASLTVTTEADLRAGFDSFVDTLRSQHVTDFIRLAEASVQLDDQLISGRYVTHLLANGLRIIPPFRSQITLRYVGDHWCGASISNALANSRWPLLMPGLPLHSGS